MTESKQPLPPSAGSGPGVHGRVSEVSGGQVAIGGRVFQIDAQQGAHVVINADAEVSVTRRPSPVLRPSPPFPGLVGRTRELGAIRTALAAGRSVEVVGTSGIGKTALLRAASNADLPATTPDGVVAVPPQLGVRESLNFVYDACYEGSRRVVPRREELAAALAELRILLVLDDPGLDRDQIDVLRQSLPLSLLMLAAHEPRVYASVDGLRLEGLDDEDGVRVIEAGVGRPLSDRERDVGSRVCQVLRGTPIELVRFAGLVRTDPDGDLVTVARGFGVDAQPSDVLTAVQRNTSDVEDAVLAALAAFGAPVGASPVAAVSGRRDAGEILSRLATRGLVAGDDLEGWRPRVSQAASVDERRHATTVFSEWIRRRSVPEEVAAEIPAITSLLASAEHDERYVDLVTLAAAAERPLALAGRWSAWEQTLEAGVRAARAIPDAASERFFAHQLSVMHEAMTGAPPTMAAQRAEEPTDLTQQSSQEPPQQPSNPLDVPSAGGQGPVEPPARSGAPDRPWWRRGWGAALMVAGVVLAGAALVAVVGGLLTDADDNGGGGGGGNGGTDVAVADVQFGDVSVGSEVALGRLLDLTEALPPLEVVSGGGPFGFFLSDTCGSPAQPCPVDVVFGPVDVGPAETVAEVVDSTGTVVARVTASGTGVDVGVDRGPNLVAFTLAEESAQIALDTPEVRTVRVLNQDGEGVGPAEGGLMFAEVSGPAELLDPEIDDCELLTPQEMSCRVGPLGVAQAADIPVVLVGVEAGDVTVTTSASSLATEDVRSQVRVFTVVGERLRPEQVCTVPDVLGLVLDDADAVLAEEGLLMDPLAVEDGQASGVVLRQSPDPGTTLDCGAVVVVEFSGLA